jgi:two-component system NarL family sensor kinase
MFQETTTDTGLVIFYAAGTLFVFLMVVFLLMYIYLHQLKVTRFNIQLRDQELKKQQELFLALNEGEEKERKRLAEELHDGIGAKLSGLKMSVEYLKSRPEVNDPLLEKIAEGMNETIEELREISQNLKPSFLSSKGLELALNELMVHYNHKGSCSYQLFMDVNEDGIENYVQLIYRIVSELLHNIQKHSQATLASVQIIAGEEDIQIIVEDNGVGFDLQEHHNGIGLVNISNRVELYKGKLHIDSTGKGTVVIIEFPITGQP